mgnify:CR=1 FL=1
MLYRVVHETAYAYSTPVELAHHLAHLCPLDHAAQERIDYVCDIHPEPEHRHSDVDVFGNRREFFAYYSPHDTLTVRAVSLVQVRAPKAPDWEASPPWEQVREQLLYRAGKPYVAEAEYTFGTHFSPLFAAAGARQWVYQREGRNPVAMPYWTVPEDAYDDPDEMARWVHLAFEAGLRAEAEKARPKPGRGSAKMRQKRPGKG